LSTRDGKKYEKTLNKMMNIVFPLWNDKYLKIL
jgi:hypothetical protein